MFALLLVGVALWAADLGHGIVAMLGRSGLIASPYGAYYHETIVPVLLTGLVCTTIVAAATFGDALVRAAGYRGDWLANCAQFSARINFLVLAPIVFSLQLALLCAMESIEQIVTFGQPLGFTAALGAPLLLALGVHALMALFVCGAAVLFSRALAQAARALTQAVEPYIRRLLRAQSSTPSTQCQYAISRIECARLKPLARRIANRPPPFAASIV